MQGRTLSPDGACGGNVVDVSECSLEDAYERWADELVRYAAALVAPADAADVVAEAFVSLLRNQGSWRQARDPRRFLFGVVANAARVHHRRNSRRDRRQRRTVALTAVSAQQPPEGDDPNEVIAALSVLTVQQRAVIYLAYWEDLAVTDIADVLGVSDGTVRRQLARARARLRKEMS